MLYIFTALYCEAHIFIKQFNLIKNQETTCFQEFYNEICGIRLTITGVGEIAVATAIGSVCSVYKPTQDDLLLNVGICAHTTKNSGIFLCNKIKEKATGRTFYPDMLYRHNFYEGTIVTGMLPWNINNEPLETTTVPAGNLYDMEAAAVYQAGVHFFGPHQMIFLKIVSDRGTIDEVSKERATLLMEQYQDCIIDYVLRICAIIPKLKSHNSDLCQEEKQLLETFCADLHLSKTMRDSMKQYVQYLTLTGINYISVIHDMYEKNLIPCKDKREGKQRFEEFKRRLF